MTKSHKTVLPAETLEYAHIGPDDVVFEGTGGEAGLSRQIVSRLGPDGKLIITELDRSLVANLRKELADSVCEVHVQHDNFRNVSSILNSLGVREVDVIILDLGLASYHYEESGRGFSFMKNEPLLMTLDDSPAAGVSARDAVNTWKEETLAEIFAGFGGERKSKQIAKAIVAARRAKSIETTADLVTIIGQVVGKARGALNPATRVFQALRIAINDEIGALRQVLRDGWTVLSLGGRFITISFHEGEDREVKVWFKHLESSKAAVSLKKGATKATKAEMFANRRSRSARLRAVKKIKMEVP